MQISDVKKQVLQAINRAKRGAAERQTRTEEAAREYEAFLESVAIPIFRQVANVLRAEGYPFTVFTPGGSVRLMSDRASDDYIEVALDTGGDRPTVVGHSRHLRGRRVTDAERPLGASPIRDLTADDV